MGVNAANRWQVIFVASWLSFSTAARSQSASPTVGQYICPGTALIQITGLGYPPGSVPKNMELTIGAPTKIVRVDVLRNSRNRAQAYILLEGHSVQFYVYPPESGGPAQSACGSSAATESAAATSRSSGLKKPDWPQPVAATAENQQPELLQALQGKYQQTDPPEKLMDLVWKTILLKCKRPTEKEPSIFYESLSIEADRGIAPQGNFEGQTNQTFAIMEFGGPFRIVTSPVKRDFSRLKYATQAFNGVSSRILFRPRTAPPP